MISMTWPQYLRRECCAPDLVRLTPTEAELLAALLIRRPVPMPSSDLIDVLYPDPDAEPDYALNIVYHAVMSLRCKGIAVVSTPHGYEVAA